MTLGKARRRELGKFVLDLGRVTFGGTVVTQLFSATAGSTAILLAGFGVTLVAMVVVLIIIPEE